MIRPAPSEQTDVLLLGDRRQTLTVIRSLARSDYRITMGQTAAPGYGTWSRYCSESWNHPVIAGDGSRFIESLNKFLQQNPQVTLLFPTGDSEIRTLTRFRDDLPGVQIVMPARKVVERCHDKVAMCRLVEELGVPLAPFAIVACGEKLANAAERIGYPCIVRPQNQFLRLRGEKVIICSSPAEVAELDSDSEVRETERIAQRYVCGPRHNLYFIARRGELERYVEVKVLRTDRLDATGMAVDNVSVEPNPAIVQACQMLAKRLDYTGLGCAQFILDADDRPQCFLEINPRLGAAIALPYACGVDFPRLAIEQLLGHTPLDARPDDYRRGVRFGWLFGDLQGVVHALNQGNASVVAMPGLALSVMRTFLSARVHPTWSLNDPLPTCINYLRFARSGVRRLLTPTKRALSILRRKLFGLNNPFDQPIDMNVYHNFRPQYHEIPFALIREYLGRQVDRALDVACGTGHSSSALTLISGSVAACDASTAMLEIARENPDIDFQLSSAETLPYEDGRFSLVNVSMGYHWFDEKKFLREVERVLEPGGYLSVDSYGCQGQMKSNWEFMLFHELFYKQKFQAAPRGAEFPSQKFLGKLVCCREFHFEHFVPMDLDSFTGFLMSQSNLMINRSYKTPEFYRALRETYAPYFAGGTQELMFGGKSRLYRLMDRVNSLGKRVDPPVSLRWRRSSRFDG